MAGEVAVTILNVDDNEAGRYSISRLLRHAGFQIIEATSGAEALQRGQEQPDLIVLDVQLPDMSGFEVCRQLKANPATALIPVLMVSAIYLTAEATVQGLNSGADGYLTEPVAPQVLVAYITALLRARRAEAELARSLRENQRQQRLLERLVKNVPAAIAVMQGPEHCYSLANPEYQRMVRNKDDLIGRTVSEIWPELGDPVMAVLDRVYQTGEPFSAVDVPFHLEGETGLPEEFYTFTCLRLEDEYNQPEAVVVLGQETTAQVQSRQRIEEAYALLDALFEAAPIGLGFLDRELRFIRVNPALAALNGLPIEAHLGKTVSELVPDFERLDEILAAWRRVIETGQPLQNVELTGEVPARRGDKRTWLSSWYPVKIGEETIGLGVVIRDITERRLAEQEREQLYQAEQQARIEAQREVKVRRETEEKLQVSLQEKEILLREVNHRVKNNLQAVSHLLYLQALHIQDPQVRQKFEETQNRVGSIALIHETLYQSKNFTRINFAEYAGSLARQLIRSYRIDPGLVRLTVEGNGLYLGVETSVTVGLILNELVSNALKHAFPENRPGDLEITLKNNDDSWFSLIVQDNGIGFPRDKELTSLTGSLGLQLVRMLVNRMQGELKLERTGGTRIIITFQPATVAM